MRALITFQDLQEAIAECEGAKNPNANTCIKLAAFYTIRDNLFPQPGEEPVPVVSQSREPASYSYSSGSEFWDSAHDLCPSAIMEVFDELMETVKVINPRLYASVLRKLSEY